MVGTTVAAVLAVGVLAALYMVAAPHRGVADESAAVPVVNRRVPDDRTVGRRLEGPAPVTWVFVGDSITHGSTHTNGRRSFVEHFAERTRAELGRVDDVVINTGISGDRTEDVLAGFADRVGRFEPDVVVVMLGTNDSVDGPSGRAGFADRLAEIVTRVRGLGAIPVLQTPNPVDEAAAPERDDLPAYVDVVRTLARERDVMLVDQHRTLARRRRRNRAEPMARRPHPPQRAGTSGDGPHDLRAPRDLRPRLPHRRSGLVTGDRLQAAFDAVRRDDFLPADQRGFAGLDRALPIGFDQTNSQPRTVSNMLTLLDARPGQRVLDVGSGSGWTTALLGKLVGPQGRVLGVELVPELVAWSRENLTAYGMDWVGVSQAEEGVLGLPAEAPFDRILVSAEASTLPNPLVDQLADGGVMVVPVSGRLIAVERESADDVTVQQHGHYQFVPLR